MGWGGRTPPSRRRNGVPGRLCGARKPGAGGARSSRNSKGSGGRGCRGEGAATHRGCCQRDRRAGGSRASARRRQRAVQVPAARKPLRGCLGRGRRAAGRAHWVWWAWALGPPCAPGLVTRTRLRSRAPSFLLLSWPTRPISRWVCGWEGQRDAATRKPIGDPGHLQSPARFSPPAGTGRTVLAAGDLPGAVRVRPWPPLLFPSTARRRVPGERVASASVFV